MIRCGDRRKKEKKIFLFVGTALLKTRCSISISKIHLLSCCNGPKTTCTTPERINKQMCYSAEGKKKSSDPEVILKSHLHK